MATFNRAQQQDQNAEFNPENLANHQRSHERVINQGSGRQMRSMHQPPQLQHRNHYHNRQNHYGPPSLIRNNRGGHSHNTPTPLINLNQSFHHSHEKIMDKNERKDHAGMEMEGNITECLICCQKSDLYGIGECLHPICMECAIRLRVTGQSPSKACPQCRTEIDIMYFISSPPGQELIVKIPQVILEYPDAAKHGFKFSTDYSKKCYQSYLSHKCYICSKRGNCGSFTSFSTLIQHMAQMHNLTFCRICCDNLNVLTKDRKVYSRDELQKHMVGKLSDEEGFSGHPSCLFCDQRFYDEEHQYRHLRRDHSFCHLCDEDGANNCFYKNQEKLNQHNRRLHKPCLDPECLQVGIVFRDEVGLEMHRARHHLSLGGGGRPSTIHIDLNFRRTRGNEARSRYDDHRTPESHERTFQPENVRIVPSAQSNFSIRQSTPSLNQAQTQQMLSLEFPALPLNANNNVTINNSASTSSTNWAQRNPVLTEQFPSLVGSTPPSTVQNQNSAWNKGNSKDLFKNKPPKKEEPKRQKLIPIPDIWPEHMQERLRARELGLPEPEQERPPHWLTPRTPEDAEEEKEKKPKKKKTKEISSAAAEKLANKKVDLVSSTSKFDALASYEENSNMTVGSVDWWRRGTQIGGPKLTPTNDGFVQITLPGATTSTNCSRVDPINAGNFSLQSIAQMLTRCENNEGAPPGFEEEPNSKGATSKDGIDHDECFHYSTEQ